ncbi:hypothetical protein [Pandoraea norimbergensis]|uniref:DUF2946 domain-containing protein n=1 Tax=Pandoraea norimbergensis TaxID=93219 RepID=A0ABM5WI27_9BURK|nr:hypothetical protein [Pandoraea norimbergensis]ALS60055.1 hypothetical protein AT302_10065 [Pandoraea norimbergensis]
MNRWRKLLVLWLLCVTLPLQALAALRTHCAPGSPVQSVAQLATPMVAMAHNDSVMADGTMHHAMGGMSHDAMSASDGTHDATLHAAGHNTSSDTATQHSHHASCSACAACVVCTALPQSLALRTPDAQPSTAIPFLRTSAASAFVAALERPPKATLV